MNTGAKIGLGLLALGGVGAAGAYMWMGSTSTMDGLLNAIPHDTVVVVTSQGIPELLEDYHILNSDLSPAFISAEQWEAMRKELPFDINPADIVVNAKLNPLGITAFTGSADFSTEVPKSLCGAYYLPSLSSKDSAEYIKTFAEEKMKTLGIPLSIESADGVYSIMEMAWTAHSDWVVFAGCEDGDPAKYLKSLTTSKNGIKGEPVGRLLGNMSKGDWQMVAAVNVKPLHNQVDTLADLDRSLSEIFETIDIKEYEAFGMKGNLGTGSMNLDLSFQLSSPNAKVISYLTEIETSKMIDRLPGDPILVVQQGLNIPQQIDLLLKADPMMQDQFEAGKTEFKAQMGMDLENDFIKKIGNQAGLALVHDEFAVGAHLWLELESGHKFKELADKAMAEMGDMGINKDEKDGSLFIQTPPSMGSMIGMPDLSLTVGVTPSELVVSAGKSTPNAVKNLGTDSISSKLDSALKSKLTGSSYGGAVVDFASARKMLDNEMVKSALDSEMRGDERKAFDTVVTALKDLSITSTLDGDTYTVHMDLNGTSGSAFSDIVKDTVIPELQKGF